LIETRILVITPELAAKLSQQIQDIIENPESFITDWFRNNRSEECSRIFNEINRVRNHVDAKPGLFDPNKIPQESMDKIFPLLMSDLLDHAGQTNIWYQELIRDGCALGFPRIGIESKKELLESISESYHRSMQLWVRFLMGGLEDDIFQLYPYHAILRSEFAAGALTAEECREIGNTPESNCYLHFLLEICKVSDNNAKYWAGRALLDMIDNVKRLRNVKRPVFTLEV